MTSGSCDYNHHCCSRLVECIRAIEENNVIGRIVLLSVQLVCISKYTCNIKSLKDYFLMLAYLNRLSFALRVFIFCGFDAQCTWVVMFVVN